MIDFILHFDEHLTAFVQNYGTLTYGILFAIIFAETGLVVTPFLPGDSLLFAAGALAATGAILCRVVLVTLIDRGCRRRCRELLGRPPPRRIVSSTMRRIRGGFSRVVKREHVLRAHEFFERHGGKAVVLARFVPIVRTFVPFVAGGAQMTYRTFAIYNVTGRHSLGGHLRRAGYLFGNIPVVKENFELVVLGDHRRVAAPARVRGHQSLASAGHRASLIDSAGRVSPPAPLPLRPAAR